MKESTEYEAKDFLEKSDINDQLIDDAKFGD